MSVKDLIPKNWRKKNLPVQRRTEEDPFTQLHQQMNRLFDDFSQDFGLPSLWRSPFDIFKGNGGALGNWNPSVDVSETDKEIKVTAELPGMDEKDVNVELTDDALNISGEKKTEKEEKDKNYYRSERSYGSFHRTIPLPVEVDKDKVQAAFKKGILTVNLPKTVSAQANTKRIAVKAG
jgi:HSP20 family protein